MSYANNKFASLFDNQKSNQYEIGNSSYSDRIKKLNKLKKAVEVTYRNKIREAL